MCLLVRLMGKTAALIIFWANGVGKTADESAELQGSSGRIYLRGARCETVVFLCGHVISCPPSLLHNVEEQARAFGSVMVLRGLTRHIHAPESSILVRRNNAQIPLRTRTAHDQLGTKGSSCYHANLVHHATMWSNLSHKQSADGSDGELTSRSGTCPPVQTCQNGYTRSRTSCITPHLSPAGMAPRLPRPPDHPWGSA